MIDDSSAAEAVAVIGMAGRFPGAQSPDEFWQNLMAGKDGITRFPSRTETDGSHYVGARSVLENPDLFDASFFGIYPKEAELMDPQHRVFLECAWEALEDAGYDPHAYSGMVGVYAGLSLNTYLLHNLGTGGDLANSYQVAEYQTMLGNDKDFLPVRVSYKLNLRGPSMAIQSACSTSLVAICQAATALLTYQCDMALSGGVSITFPQQRDYRFQEEGMVSPDGTCRAFDADAAGTVFGHGCGVVLLKRLGEAIADGDPILAVIKGWAVNNDGSDKIGFAAPGLNAQAEVIAMAQASAGVKPSEISYIEAHGTGTPLGDPIEIAALTKAFRQGGCDENAFCAIGTGKTHIGHLDCAAGVTGLIKTIQQLRHEKIPALLHFKAANPRIDFANSPFVPVSEDRDWKAGGEIRRAGISAFGVGGTNAHIVLEEAPEAAASSSGRKQNLLILSAKSPAALTAIALNLADFIEREKPALADVCYTLAKGRHAFAHRRIVVAATHDEAIAKLREPGKSTSAAKHAPRMAFLFPGQGSQYPEMGREIYDSEPIFRAAIDECATLLRPHLQHDIRGTLFPSEGEREMAARDLHRTALTQPCIFATEYALAKLWASWGVKPALVIGHSIGEYVAAVIAETFKLEHALQLLASRARLMQELPSGDMLAVRASAESLALPDGIEIAAVNSSQLCTVSGTHVAIAGYQVELAEKNIGHRLLSTSHAFHSAMMEPMVSAFTDDAAMIPANEPNIAWISTCTGQAIDSETLVDPAYWARQLRQTVRFSDAMAVALQHEDLAFLEVGPGRALAPFALQHPARTTAPVVSSLPSSATDLADLLSAAGALWENGVAIDWTAFYQHEKRCKLHLPTYPFERKSFWIDRSVPAQAAVIAPEPASGPETFVPEVSLVVVDRLSDLHLRLAALVQDLSGITVTDDAATFTELGFDSLFLTQASQAIQSRFAVKVTFRQMLGELSSVAALAKHLDHEMPASTVPIAARTTEQAASPDGLSTVRWPEGFSRDGQVNTRFGPYKPLDKGEKGGLTPIQQNALDQLIQRYTAKTPSSKNYTAEHRPHYADPRAVSGFKSAWKEMVYPIVSERSKDAQIWDIDGNQYVDITMGFGTYFFGHSPAWLVEAIEEQLRSGIEIGPQSKVAGKLAKAICELTQMERATFCNTGSEAVMAAMRLARTITGRQRIAYFTGDYHGMFEEVLVRGAWVNGVYKAQPIAPGIPHSLVENILVLDYADPASLEILRAHAHELAAVMVEPVQSRAPALQPREFMHEVRAITARSGTALIFDEVVTGFRCAPGGAQAYFGVQADMATYGKVIGGGMPIGVLTGKKEYLDALDGGAWNYGDDSFPEVGVTFFAGTFVRHPLALAAAWRVVQHLMEEGPRMQIEMEERVARVCRTLNTHLETIGVPIRIPHFSAHAVIDYAPELKYASLLWFFLREKGIHIWEGRPLYFTTAHTDEDLDHFVTAFAESVAEMQKAGFLPASVSENMALPVGFPRFDHAPTTAAQLEIFYAVQLGDEANCSFNESNVIHLEGELDSAALRTALSDIVTRHPSFRSTFSENGLTQFFYPSEKVIDLIEHDFTSILATSAIAMLPVSLIKSAETALPFDLVNGPLIRLHLVHLPGGRHELLFTAHHIICDGWSFGMILAELATAYNARKHKKLPRLAPAMSFADYARLEAKNLASEESIAAENFWVAKFSKGAPVLDLPTDLPPTQVKGFNGAMEKITIYPALYAELKKASPALGGTLFATLLSSFATLLRRMTGQEDIVIGVPAAAQTRIGCDELIGHCLNFLPLRLAPLGETSFSNFAAEVREQVLEAYDHQNYTFGSLLQKIKLPRDARRVPLVSAIFNIDKSGIDQIHFEGLKLDVETNAKQFVNFDLFFNLIQTDDRLVVECEYNTGLFSKSFATRMLGHFEKLLTEIVAHPTEPLRSLQFLTDPEKDLVAGQWSQGPVPISCEGSLASAFLEIAKAQPTRTALICENQAYTYRELEMEASHLAKRLLDAGVQPGECIPFCCQPTAEMIVAALAILLAGACCVPIDPDYPIERFTLLLTECGAKRALTAADCKKSFPPSWDGTLLTLEPLGNATAAAELPLPTLSPDAPAYVLFTSGSTGKPKGVQLPHFSIMRLVRDRRFINISGDDVFLQTAPVSFDASLLEIWGALLNGGKLILLPDGPSLDSIAHAVQQCGVTFLWLTSGLFKLMVDEQPAALKGLRSLFTGGEAISQSHARRALESLAGTRIFNGYGPTENGIFTTCHALSLADFEKPSLPIGKPISGTTVYILDQDLSPVPTGFTGELCTGGHGLALGYLAAPELTAEKFIDHPEFGKLYKTGDLCRWSVAGEIEYIGRRDHQVKVRGFRVELGEIEAALLTHPHVRQAKVAIRKDTSETSRILAWVIAGDASLTAQDLTTYLAESLPAYLRPDAIGVISAFPLTGNGKIDLAALPDPGGRAQMSAISGNTPPQGATEIQLAAIWRELLNVPDVSRNDDFFELGGHSLMALRMFSRINREFGKSLPLAILLHHPTLAGLAAQITPATPSAAIAHHSSGNIVTLTPGGFEPPLFCIHGGDGGVIFYRNLAALMPASMPFHAIESLELSNSSAISSHKIEETAAAYIGHVLAIHPSGPIRLAGYSFGGVVAHEMACQLSAQSHQVEFLGLFDTHNPSVPERSYRILERLGVYWEQSKGQPLLPRFALLRARICQGMRTKSAVRAELKLATSSGPAPAYSDLRRVQVREENWRAMAAFIPKVFQGRITLFKASLVNDKLECRADYGWAEFAKGGLEVVPVTGEHLTLFADENIQILANGLSKAIAKSAKSTAALDVTAPPR